MTLSAMESFEDGMSQTESDQWFYGKSHKELDLVFEHAPCKAREIVDHLRDPQALCEPEYRSILFVGEPGTGKTTTALAIAYKSAWKCKFIRASMFQKSYRNRSAETLLSELEEVKYYIDSYGWEL